MDNKRIATELVRLAKSIVAFTSKKYLIRESNEFTAVHDVVIPQAEETFDADDMARTIGAAAKKVQEEVDELYGLVNKAIRDTFYSGKNPDYMEPKDRGVWDDWDAQPSGLIHIAAADENSITIRGRWWVNPGNDDLKKVVVQTLEKLGYK